ncbi:MAG: CC/Se motif family (seleno)protein [Desulfarculaceae bacterium]|jgi:hypothetical protein
MVQIKVTPRAKRFVQENGITDLTFVHHAPDVACCLGVTHEVLSASQPPTKPEDYHHLQADGINLYVDRALIMGDRLTLTVRGIFKKRLDLDGLICKVI